MRQQNSLYGHIIRAEADDIMKRLTINERFEPPHQEVRRSGRPRESWVWSNNSYAMKTHCNDTFDQSNETHLEMISFLAHSGTMGTRNLE